MKCLRQAAQEPESLDQPLPFLNDIQTSWHQSGHSVFASGRPVNGQVGAFGGPETEMQSEIVHGIEARLRGDGTNLEAAAIAQDGLRADGGAIRPAQLASQDERQSTPASRVVVSQQ